MMLILQTALTGAGLLSTLMQFVAGRDTETGRNLRIAGAAFVLLSSAVGICGALMERRGTCGTDDEALL